MLKYEQFVDMTEYKDSMELSSGTEICHLYKDGREAYIEVCGEVRVVYKDNDYRDVCDMPKELVEMFRDGSAYESQDVFIDFNNWFELFWGEDETHCPESGDVDIEGYTPEQLLSLCMEVIDVEGITNHESKM